MTTLARSSQFTNMREAMDYQPPALLIKNYCRKYEVPEQEARQQFEELKKFLIVCAEGSDRSHAPSVIIDEMWHAFVLHTQDYQEFCSHYFGQFIHHNPSEGPATLAYRHTLEALRLEFNDVNLKYWPKDQAGDCSTPSECGGSGGSGEGGCTSRCTEGDDD